MVLVKMAQRIGGFAGTTAARWVSNTASTLPTPTPVTKKPGVLQRAAKPVVLAAATSAAAAGLSRSVALRRRLAEDLRRGAQAVRATDTGGTSASAAPASKSNGTSSSNGNGSNGISQKTRAELYEMAKKADISGRSNMSKEQLIKALSH